MAIDLYKGGSWELVRTPVISGPADASTGTTIAPTLSASTYSPLYSNDARQVRRFQIILDGGDWATPLYEATENADSHQISAQLSTLTAHQWRCRDETVSGVVSEWSDPATFTTADIYVEAPTLTVPGSPADVTPSTITLTAGVFSVFNSTDTHIATEWEIVQGGSTIWTHSDPGDLTSVTVPHGVLVIGAEHTFRVRYQGSTFGYSAWAEVVATTATVSVDTPVLTVPGSPTDVMSVGLTISGSAFSTAGRSDTHASTDWQLLDGQSAVLWQSIDDTSNLTSIAVPDDQLATVTSYTLRVRYNSTTYDLTSGWASVAFTTADIFVESPTLTVPGAPSDVTPGSITLSSASVFNVVNGSDTHKATEWEVRRGGALVWSKRELTTLDSVVIPHGELTINETHTFRVRYEGNTYGFSAWTEVTATTANVVADTPVLTIPGYPGNVVPAGLSVSTGLISMTGRTDTHAASDWQLLDSVGGVIWESLNDTVNKTSIGIPDIHLDVLTDYTIRVRHHSSLYGVASEWAPLSFTSADIYIEAPSITVPGSPSDVDPHYIEVTSGAFSVHNASDSHVATIWELWESGVLVWSSRVTSGLYAEIIPKGNVSVNTTYTLKARHEGSSMGLGRWAEVTFTTANVTVDTPVLTVPGAPSSVVPVETDVTGSAFTINGRTDTHVSTEWELRDGQGSLIWSIADGVNLTSVTLPASQLDTLSSYTLRARYESSEYDIKSAWGSVAFNTLDVYVETPTVNVGDLPPTFGQNFSSSSFSVFNSVEDQTRAEWQIVDGSATVVASGLETAPGSFTSYSIPADVLLNATTYTARVRHEDAVWGWSSWGETVFTTLDMTPEVPVVSYTGQPANPNPDAVEASTNVMLSPNGGTHVSTYWVVEDVGGNPVDTFNATSGAALTSKGFSAQYFDPASNYTVKARHTKLFGGIEYTSAFGTVDLTTTAVTINAPTVSVENAPDVLPIRTLDLTTSIFSTTGLDNPTHDATDWELVDNALTVVWSSYNDTVNKTAITVPEGVTETASTYTIRVRHKSAWFGWSAWTEVVFTTIDIAVTITEVSKFFDFGGATYADETNLNPSLNEIEGTFGFTTTGVTGLRLVTWEYRLLDNVGAVVWSSVESTTAGSYPPDQIITDGVIQPSSTYTLEVRGQVEIYGIYSSWESRAVSTADVSVNSPNFSIDIIDTRSWDNLSGVFPDGLDGFTLSNIDDFSVTQGNSDTYVESQIRVRRVSDSTVIWGPVYTTTATYTWSENVLRAGEDYKFECRVRGSTYGWSSWSVREFFTASVVPDARPWVPLGSTYDATAGLMATGTAELSMPDLAGNDRTWSESVPGGEADYMYVTYTTVEVEVLDSLGNPVSYVVGNLDATLGIDPWIEVSLDPNETYTFRNRSLFTINGAGHEYTGPWEETVYATANTYPEKPINTHPGIAATDISINTSLAGSVLSLGPDESLYTPGAVHELSEVELFVGSGVTPVYTNQITGSNTTVPINGYTLTIGETYEWRIRYKVGGDNWNHWTPWSDRTAFTTALVQTSPVYTGDKVLSSDGLAVLFDLTVLLPAVTYNTVDYFYNKHLLIKDGYIYVEKALAPVVYKIDISAGTYIEIDLEPGYTFPGTGPTLPVSPSFGLTPSGNLLYRSGYSNDCYELDISGSQISLIQNHGSILTNQAITVLYSTADFFIYITDSGQLAKVHWADLTTVVFGHSALETEAGTLAGLAGPMEIVRVIRLNDGSCIGLMRFHNGTSWEDYRCHFSVMEDEVINGSFTSVISVSGVVTASGYGFADPEDSTKAYLSNGNTKVWHLSTTDLDNAADITGAVPAVPWDAYSPGLASPQYDPVTDAVYAVDYNNGADPSEKWVFKYSSDLTAITASAQFALAVATDSLAVSFDDGLFFYPSLVSLDQPTITAPANNATGIQTLFTASVSAPVFTGGYGYASATNYRITRVSDGLVVDEVSVAGGADYADTLYGLTAGETYTIEAQHKSAVLLSAWSPPVTFTMEADYNYVAAPTTTAPANTATGVTLPVDLTVGAFAMIKGSDTHEATEFEIVDSGDVAVESSGTLGAVTTYQISTVLASLTGYKWRTRMKGAIYGWSEWSAYSTFTTAEIVVNTPTVIAPIAGAVDVVRPVTLQASAFSATGAPHTHTATEFEVYANDETTLVKASGTLGAVTSYAIPGIDVDQNTTYKWRVRYQSDITGWSAWSVFYDFTTIAATIDTPSNVYPTAGELNLGLEPILEADAFTVSNGTDTHQFSRWRIYDSTPTLIYDSGDVAASTTHAVPANTLTVNTTYTWDVQYSGTQLGVSGYSTATGFTTVASLTFPYLMAGARSSDRRIYLCSTVDASLAGSIYDAYFENVGGMVAVDSEHAIILGSFNGNGRATKINVSSMSVVEQTGNIFGDEIDNYGDDTRGWYDSDIDVVHFFHASTGTCLIIHASNMTSYYAYQNTAYAGDVNLMVKSTGSDYLYSSINFTYTDGYMKKFDSNLGATGNGVSASIATGGFNRSYVGELVDLETSNRKYFRGFWGSNETIQFSVNTDDGRVYANTTYAEYLTTALAFNRACFGKFNWAAAVQNAVLDPLEYTYFNFYDRDPISHFPRCFIYNVGTSTTIQGDQRIELRDYFSNNSHLYPWNAADTYIVGATANSHNLFLLFDQITNGRTWLVMFRFQDITIPTTPFNTNHYVWPPHSWDMIESTNFSYNSASAAIYCGLVGPEGYG